MRLFTSQLLRMVLPKSLFSYFHSYTCNSRDIYDLFTAVHCVETMLPVYRSYHGVGTPFHFSRRVPIARLFMLRDKNVFFSPTIQIAVSQICKLFMAMLLVMFTSRGSTPWIFDSGVVLSDSSVNIFSKKLKLRKSFCILSCVLRRDLILKDFSSKFFGKFATKEWLILKEYKNLSSSNL